MVTDTERYQRILDRDVRYNGRFLTGVLTTGIYCLPSCPARKPKLANVRFFADEAAARAAGLRPCLRCRPDLYYRGQDSDEAIYEGLQARLLADCSEVADPGALARLAGVSRTKLGTLCREHGHTSPAALLRHARQLATLRHLQASDAAVADIAYAVGYGSEATFHRQFLAEQGMTPGSYRSMLGGSSFTLRLPQAYRSAEVLAYLGRDPDGPAERRTGNHLCKAMLVQGQAIRLSLALAPGQAHCEVASEQRLMPATMAAAHQAALRCLGLWRPQEETLSDPQALQLQASQPGLVFPLSASVWEALVWAIVGQQVNLTFAGQLRRQVILLAGADAGCGMQAHPSPAAVAALDPALLCERKFSRSKASYLVDTARHLVEQGIDIEQLPYQSAPAALRRLTALRGIGPWTAQYTLLRGAGFADCVPVGDAGLVAALQRQFALPQRPDAAQTQALMACYAPHRSLATARLWASLKPMASENAA